MAVPLCNFGTTKLQLTGNVTKGHIFVAKNESIQYLAAFQQYWHNIRTSAWKRIFCQKWPKIEKKSRFFYFNHFCWQNWEYIQRNRSQNKKEVYFLISSKFDPIFKICQGCKIFRIFLNSPFPWWKMVLHTKFRAYGTKIELPTSQNVVWPTIMAQTLYTFVDQAKFDTFL